MTKIEKENKELKEVIKALLELAHKAATCEMCVPLDEAFDGKHNKEWRKLKEKLHKLSKENYTLN